MENNEYNSLTQKLIQSGIIQDNTEQKDTSEVVNFFNANTFNAENSTVAPAEKPISNKRRINNYDLELLEKADYPINLEKESNFKKILYKVFPKLYEFKIAKDAIQKMDELGIDANSLLDKSVPYGEGEMRYKNLVKFIKYANEIQTKLKRK